MDRVSKQTTITAFASVLIAMVLASGCATSQVDRLAALRYIEAMRIADRSPHVAMARLDGVLQQIPEWWDEAEFPPEITQWEVVDWLEPDPDNPDHPPYLDSAPDLLLFVTTPGPGGYALIPMLDRPWRLWPIVRINSEGRIAVVAGGLRDFLADVIDRLAEDEDYTAGAQEAWLRLRLGIRDRDALDERLAADREYWAEFTTDFSDEDDPLSDEPDSETAESEPEVESETEPVKPDSHETEPVEPDADSVEPDTAAEVTQ